MMIPCLYSLLFEAVLVLYRPPPDGSHPGRHSYALETAVALRVAFADFSAAPWQGFEKSERCPNNSSLFLPQAAVVVVAVRALYSPPPDGSHPDRHSYALGTAH